jgi:hypothetical protein
MRTNGDHQVIQTSTRMSAPMFDTSRVNYEGKITNACSLIAKDRDERAIAEIRVYAATA